MKSQESSRGRGSENTRFSGFDNQRLYQEFLANLGPSARTSNPNEKVRFLTEWMKEFDKRKKDNPLRDLSLDQTLEMAAMIGALDLDHRGTRGYIAKIEEVSVEKLEGMSLQALVETVDRLSQSASRVVFSCYPHAKFLDGCCRKMREEFNQPGTVESDFPQQFRSINNSLVNLNYRNESFMGALFEKAMGSSVTLSPQDISSGIRAYADLGLNESRHLKLLIDKSNKAADVGKATFGRSGMRMPFEVFQDTIKDTFYLSRILSRTSDQALKYNLERRIKERQASIEELRTKNPSLLTGLPGEQQKVLNQQLVTIYNVYPGEWGGDKRICGIEIRALRDGLRRGSAPTTSKVQEDVIKVIQDCRRGVRGEEWIPEAATNVDIFIPSTDSGAKGIIVQIDGPTHYYYSDYKTSEEKIMNAKTMQNTKILESLGYKVVRIDVDEVNKINDIAISGVVMTKLREAESGARGIKRADVGGGAGGGAGGGPVYMSSDFLSPSSGSSASSTSKSLTSRESFTPSFRSLASTDSLTSMDSSTPSKLRFSFTPSFRSLASTDSLTSMDSSTPSKSRFSSTPSPRSSASTDSLTSMDSSTPSKSRFSFTPSFRSSASLTSRDSSTPSSSRSSTSTDSLTSRWSFTPSPRSSASLTSSTLTDSSAPLSTSSTSMESPLSAVGQSVVSTAGKRSYNEFNAAEASEPSSDRTRVEFRQKKPISANYRKAGV